MPGEKSYKRMVKCKCPKCEKMHKAQIFYTGNGIPRVACQGCKGYFEKEGEKPEQYTVSGVISFIKRERARQTV